MRQFGMNDDEIAHQNNMRLLTIAEKIAIYGMVADLVANRSPKLQLVPPLPQVLSFRPKAAP